MTPKTLKDHKCHLVIVFTDMSNSTGIASSLEPEHYRELLETIRTITSDVVSTHGGEIVQIEGDGLTFIFGHPICHEDPGRRAIEASIDLHNAVNALNDTLPFSCLPVRMHTGIHSGVVLVREGNIKTGKFEILGDPTNVTSRLGKLAAEDEIIVSDQALGADQFLFHTAQPRDIHIRGKQGRLLVHKVLSRATTSNRFSARALRSESGLAGREEELASLLNYADQNSSPERKMAVVSGVAGIGKSRLTQEFLSRAALGGHSTHLSYCEAYLRARPLQPISQIALSILKSEYGLASDADTEETKKCLGKIDASIVNPLMQLLTEASSETEHKPHGTEYIFRALVTLVNKIESPQKIILCIDDWQWADNASQRAIETLLKSVTTPFLIVLTTRNNNSLIQQMTKVGLITLSPLNNEESECVIEGLIKAPEPFVIEKIKEYAGGNPLFIEELCHGMRNGLTDFEQTDKGAWLKSLIHFRLSTLSDDEAKLVRTAAVIGHIIPIWLFEEMTGSSLRHPIFQSLVQKDFIYPAELSGMMRFKHGITRDVIYETIDLYERRSIHGRIVEALHQRSIRMDEDEPFDRLSYHYSNFGNYERALHYAVKAGDKALSTASLDHAQAHYRHALEEIEKLENGESLNKLTRSIVTKFGLSAIVDPSWKQVPILEKAINRAALNNDLTGQASAQYWLGFILYGLGEAKLAIPQFEASKRLAETSQIKKLIFQSQSNLAHAHAAACDYEKALPLLDRGIKNERMRLHIKGAELSLAYSLSIKAFLLADQGHFETSSNHFDEAMEILSGLDHQVALSVINLRGACAIWQGQFDKARYYSNQVLSMAGCMRSRYHYAMSRTIISAAKIYESPKQSLNELATMTNATDWMATSSTHQFVSLNYGYLADLLTTHQQYDKARHYAAKAILRARKGDRLGEAMAYRALARSSHYARSSKSAEHYLELAYKSAKLRNSPREKAMTQLCESIITRAQGNSHAASILDSKAQETCKALNIELAPFKT